MGVGSTCFLFLFIYLRLKRVSIILARVDGLPIPFSFINSRISSSSTCFPAVSIALNKVASVNCLGGLVCFSKKEGSCGPFSPLTKVGNIPVSFFPLESDVSKTTRHPFFRISFPVVLKLMVVTFPITVVLETSQSS